MATLLLCATELTARGAETQLAIINAAVSTSEDGPRIASDYSFLPGDYVYVQFQIAGFTVRTENRGEVQKIALEYEITLQDEQHRPVVAPESGKIETELSAEDKNWVPLRRASFLLPSFLAANPFHVHIAVKDVFDHTAAEHDLPFKIGGVHVQPSSSILVQNFRFLRGEADSEALSVAAFAPGDPVYARFEMTGFRTDADNAYHLAYGITVFAPNGKPFIQEPEAANLAERSFYPAQFIPGNMELKLGKDSARGEYVVVVKVRDVLADKTYESKHAFTVE